MPECGFTISPLDAVHCWLAPPLHGHHSMRVPLVYLAPVMSMQPPSIVSVPLELTVQFCAPVLPSQSQIWTLLPLVPLALLLSTHLVLLRPDTIVPVAPLLVDDEYPAATMLACTEASVEDDGKPDVMAPS